MPSTYTTNNGIELIGTGEQSGTWGATTNTNFNLIDTALDGQLTKTLPAAGTSGSPNTLIIQDGITSDGRNRLVIFNDGSDLSGTAYVQLTPDNAEKIMFVRNSLSGGRSIIFFQGTYNASNDFELPNGTDAVIKFNGGGSGAVVEAVFKKLYLQDLLLDTSSAETMYIESTTPTFNLKETDAATNEKFWRFQTSAGVFKVDAVNDAYNTAATAYSVDRSGVTPNLHIWYSNASEAMRITSAGNVGIGTSTPTEKLHISKDSAFSIQMERTGGSPSISEFANSANLLNISNNVTGIAFLTGGTPTEKMRINASGGVGIGTTTPATALDVNGLVTATGLDINGNSDFAGNLNLSRSGGTSLTRTTNTDFISINSGSGAAFGSNITLYAGSHASLPNYGVFESDTMLFRPVDDSPEFMRFVDGTGTVFNETNADLDFRIESDVHAYSFFLRGSDGNIGMGTSVPSSNLEIADLAGAAGIEVSAYRNGTTYGNSYIQFNGPRSSSGDGSTVDGRGAITLLGNSSGVQGSLWINAASATLLPATADEATMQGYQAGLNLNSDGTLAFWDSGSQRFLIDSTGSVGIGTSTPQALLDVTGATGNQLVVGTTANASSTEAGILFKQHTTVSNFDGGGIRSIRSGTTNDFGLAFDVGRNGVSTQAMFISGADATPGYVGIGTSSPVSLFTVSGSATVTGNFGVGGELDLTNATNNFIDHYGTLRMRYYDGASFYDTMSISPTAVVFNDTGRDLDFRVESNTLQAAFVVRGSDGRVGINEANPTEPLHVSRLGGTDSTLPAFNAVTAIVTTPGTTSTGSGTAITIHSNVAGTSVVYFSDTDDSDIGYIAYAHSDDSMRFNVNNSERMRFNSSGDLGIGTALPRSQVHVYGAGQATSALTDSGDMGGILRVSGSGSAAGTGGGIIFASQQSDDTQTAGMAAIKGLLTDGSSNTTGDLAFSLRASAGATALTERMRITKDGDVIVSGGDIIPSTDNTGNIGTSANTFANGWFTNMTVDSTLSVRAAIDLADNDHLRMGSSDDWRLYYNPTGSHATIELESDVADLVITDNGTTKFTFAKSSGNLGIGTSSPTNGKLEIDNDDPTQASLYINSAPAGGWGLEIAAHSFESETDLVLNSNATIASGISMNMITAGANNFRWYSGATSNKTGTSGATNIAILTSAGDLQLKTGGLSFQTSGEGITFAGQTSVLGDYEEGTWTPTYTGQSGQPDSISYDVQLGFYTKVGSVVTVTGKIQTSGITGNFSGGIRISSLPFAARDSGDTTAAGGMVVANCVDFLDDYPCSGFLRSNVAVITLRTRDDFKSQMRDMVNTDMTKTGSGNTLSFSATYLTDD